MATPTKTGRSLLASTTSSTSETSSAWNLTTAFGGLLVASVVNGGTGPSTGCLVTVEVSHDNSEWIAFDSVRAGVAASTTYTWNWELRDAMYARVTFGSTSQSVTKRVVGHETTSVG